MTLKEQVLEKYITAAEANQLEKDTTYTLPMAMRRGAKVQPQAVGTWWSGDQACALSAAYFDAKALGYIK